MVNGEIRYRVWNKTKYDIGARLINGVEFNIKAGSFQLMTINDILFIESICPDSKFFTRKLLVPMDETGKPVEISNLGLIYEEDNQHKDDDEISAALKLPIKKFETWLEEIDDPTELHSIYEVAMSMDLPLQKIKVLKKKMPNKDWLDELT